MAQVLNTPKELWWLERIRRWQKSQLSVRLFCRRQQLSEPSFYAWRRTLAQRGLLVEPAARAAAAPSTPAFVPLQLQGAGAANSTAALLEVVLADGGCCACRLVSTRRRCGNCSRCWRASHADTRSARPHLFVYAPHRHA